MTNPWSISYNALANIKHILWIIIQTCNSVDPGGIITSCSRNTIQNTPKTRTFNYKNKNPRIFQARIEANYSMAIKVYLTKNHFEFRYIHLRRTQNCLKIDTIVQRKITSDPQMLFLFNSKRFQNFWEFFSNKIALSAYCTWNNVPGVLPNQLWYTLQWKDTVLQSNQIGLNTLSSIMALVKPTKIKNRIASAINDRYLKIPEYKDSTNFSPFKSVIHSVLSTLFPKAHE